MTTLAFIGGGNMARALIGAGHAVVGFDPVPARRARLRRCGGRAMRSIAEVAQASDLLISSLPTAAALHAVVEELRKAGKLKFDEKGAVEYRV